MTFILALAPFFIKQQLPFPFFKTTPWKFKSFSLQLTVIHPAPPAEDPTSTSSEFNNGDTSMEQQQVCSLYQLHFLKALLQTRAQMSPCKEGQRPPLIGHKFQKGPSHLKMVLKFQSYVHRSFLTWKTCQGGH